MKNRKYRLEDLRLGMQVTDEQLSDEVYTYEKEQVKRLGKKKGGNVKDEEMTEEMKELLKD